MGVLVIFFAFAKELVVLWLQLCVREGYSFAVLRFCFFWNGLAKASPLVLFSWCFLFYNIF
jgi:hypothetical protein